MWHNSLSVSDIKVGEQYQLEDKYYLIAEVTVIEDQCGGDGHLRGPNWVGWRVRIDKFIGGECKRNIGEEFDVGWDIGYSHYNSLKFKPLNSTPDYMWVGDARD